MLWKKLRSWVRKFWFWMIVIAAAIMIISTYVRVNELQSAGTDSVPISEAYEPGHFLTIAHPYMLLRGGVPEPGQPLALTLHDAKGVPLSGDYYAVFAPPDWLELVDQDGKLIRGKYSLAPGDPQSKVYLRPLWRSPDIPKQGELTILLFHGNEPAALHTRSITLQIETPLGAFVRLSSLVLFGASPLLLAVGSLLISLLYDNHRKKHEELKAGIEKEVAEIMQVVKTQPSHALQRYLAVRSRFSTGESLDVGQDTLEMVIHAHEPLEQKTGEILREAGNICADGEADRCASMLLDLSLFYRILWQDGSANPSIPQVKKMEGSLKDLALALQIQGEVDDETTRYVLVAVEIMDGPYSQDAREIGLTVLRKAARAKPQLVQYILNTPEVKNRTEFRKQGGKELSQIASYIQLPEYSLTRANTPVTPAQGNVEKWLKKLEFNQNPFYPFAPYVDLPLQPAVGPDGCILISSSRYDRAESIRAAVHYLHQNQRGIAIHLRTPFSGTGKPREREPYLTAICRGFAEIWLDLVARHPFVFLFLEAHEQMTLSELLCWSFGSLDTAILWMRQARTDNTPHGKNVIRAFQNMNGLHASASPSAARMMNWLCLRPPGISLTHLFIQNDSTQKHEKNQVADLIDLRDDLAASQVILKIFTPPLTPAFTYHLPDSPLEWINDPTNIRYDLPNQLNLRFIDSATGLGKTFESLFFPPPPSGSPFPDTTMRLVAASNNSVTRMFRIGNDLLLNHVRVHPKCATDDQPSHSDLYLSGQEFNAHLNAWKNRL